MPERKKVVIVSSTARDLPEHRKEVMDACLRQNMFPKMMEHLPASDIDAIAQSLKLIDEADIYLGIFAHRYGYVPKGHNISITEMEYNHAVERGIPLLIFLMRDDHPIPAKDVERGEGATKLEDFKKRLEGERVVTYFGSPEDLRAHVIDSLSRHRKSDGNTGPLKGSSVQSPIQSRIAQIVQRPNGGIKKKLGVNIRILAVVVVVLVLAVVIGLQFSRREPDGPPAPIPMEPESPSLQLFSFETVIVDAKGKEIGNRRKRQADFFSQNLGGNINIEMVKIPGGAFEMGSLDNEKDRNTNEVPRHRVSVPEFYIGKFEITQKQWQAVATSFAKVNRDLESNPSSFKSHGDDRPVEQVSWEEATEFCARLSQATGRTYRLPTEAEWEYACRAGSVTPFAFGETITTDLVNYNGHHPYGSAEKTATREETIPVGSLRVANAFGLYDMHGNVWEWCIDTWHDDYYNNPPTDGSEWKGGDAGYRVVRGGFWDNVGAYCRSAHRAKFAPNTKYFGIGFRIVFVPRPK